MPALPASWKHKRFIEGVPIPYRAAWSDDQFVRIAAGLVPQEMEDKWFIFYEAPHVFFHRSWTGDPVYRLTVVRSSAEHEVTEALLASNLAASGDVELNYQAKLLDFLVSNLLLGDCKPFPLPPGVGTQTYPGVLQHHIAGTSYREQSDDTPKQKPWWRFW